MTDWVSGDEAVELQYKLEMFSVPISLFRHCLMPLFQFPDFGRQRLLPVYWIRIVTVISEIIRTISIKPLPLKLILGLVIINPSWKNARQAIENPLKQSEQGTQYQARRRVDDWWVFMCHVWRIIRIIRTLKMNKIRLYIYPVIFGFVIVPLLVWPTVIALAVLIFTLTFLAEIIFSFPLWLCVFLFRNYNLSYWLNMHFFSV